MPTRYICNSLTIGMAPEGGVLRFDPISIADVRALIIFPPVGITVSHAIGHEETAQLANSQLKPKNEPVVKFARVSIRLQPGDDLVICQYIGPRLPKGTTVLPPDAKIRWYYAAYSRHEVVYTKKSHD
jgi:hypothetical protein